MVKRTKRIKEIIREKFEAELLKRSIPNYSIKLSEKCYNDGLRDAIEVLRKILNEKIDD